MFYYWRFIFYLSHLDPHSKRIHICVWCEVGGVNIKIFTIWIYHCLNSSAYYAFCSVYKLLVASKLNTINWLTQHSFLKPFFLTWFHCTAYFRSLPFNKRWSSAQFWAITCKWKECRWCWKCFGFLDKRDKYRGLPFPTSSMRADGKPRVKISILQPWGEHKNFRDSSSDIISCGIKTSNWLFLVILYEKTNLHVFKLMFMRFLLLAAQGLF